MFFSYQLKYYGWVLIPQWGRTYTLIEKSIYHNIVENKILTIAAFFPQNNLKIDGDISSINLIFEMDIHMI